MKNFSRIVILTGLLSLFAGCKTWQEADRSSRNTALVTLQSVSRMKQQLRVEIADEQQFYKSELETFDRSENRFEQNQLDRAKARNAEIQAAEFVANKTKITAEMIAGKLLNTATNYLTEAGAARATVDAKRATIEKSLIKLQLLEEEYAALSSTLTKLTVPPSDRDKIKELASFIRNVADKYKELEAEREENAQ